MRIKTAALAAATLVSSVGLSVASTTPASAKAKIKCKLSVGSAYADPIVHHKEVGPVGHLHTFFGNQNLLSLPNPNAATYADMMGKGTACENPDDTAGYWQPALIYKATGKPVPVHAFSAYYRTYDHEDFGIGDALPPDTQLVAGDAMSMTPQSTKIVNWSCGQFSSVGPTAYIPNCAAATGSVVRLTAHVTFPSCWDGRLADHRLSGNTSDNAHFAYQRKGVCPAGFPNKMTELRETISFDYPGNGSDIQLTSDMPGMRPGSSLHGDYWNTWIQTGGTFGGFVGMVRDCINSTRGSGAECG